MTSAARAPTSRATYTAVVAHRGGAALWPENSLTAVREVAALRVVTARGEELVDGVEVDVHLTADEQVVVHHDARLERTTTGSGPVRTHTSAALAALSVRGLPDGMSEPPPLLHEVAAVLAGATEGAGRVVSVELKNGVDDERYAGLAAKVLDVLQAAGVLPRAFLHAFDWGYLDELRALAEARGLPPLALGANIEAETLAAFPGWTHLLDEVVRRGARDINADHRLMTAAMLDEARERGLGVTLWTVNDDEQMARCFALGIDTLVTDRPDRALELRAAR